MKGQFRDLRTWAEYWRIVNEGKDIEDLPEERQRDMEESYQKFMRGDTTWA